MFKTVKVEDAVGMVLAHDVTEIRPGEFKGPAFKKGHKIRPQDVCHLQRLGKQHIYVLHLEQGYSHENDAAKAMADAFCGDGVSWQGEPREGKLNLFADRDGLFKVNVSALNRVNLLGEIMCASRHTNTLVAKGDIVAGTRAIPLVVKSSVVDRAVTLSRASGGLFHVTPLRASKACLIVTGNEVFTGLIEDRFESIIRDKMRHIGSEVVHIGFAPDDPALISAEIRKSLMLGADLVLITGGMSVDPDDVTRLGIKQAGGEADCYGAPILPGAMFMVAEIDSVPILGIPACALYHQTTILDLVLPRILAGDKIGREEIARMGHGGLCLNCTECRFPVCPFGKE